MSNHPISKINDKLTNFKFGIEILIWHLSLVYSLIASNDITRVISTRLHFHATIKYPKIKDVYLS